MPTPVPGRPSRATSRRPRWSRLCAPLTALAVAVISAPGALGTPGWTPARPVFEPAATGVLDPQVAFAGDGSAMAAWGRTDLFNGRLESAVVGGGGSSWGAVQSVPGFDDWAMSDIHIALDRAGGAVASWGTGHMQGETLFLASRPAGGTWTAAEPVSASPRGGFGGLAMDPDGTAMAVWPENFSFSDPVSSAAVFRVRPAGSAWSATGTIGATTAAPPSDFVHYASADVSLDPSGRAVAAWARTIGDVTTVEASWRPAGGAWSAPVPVATLPAVVRLSVRTDASGSATLLWSDGHNVEATGSAWGSDVWPAPANLTGAGGGSDGDLELAVDPRGDAVAAWTANGVVAAAVRPVGGDWSPRRNLSAGDADSPAVAVDAAGDAIVAWARYPDGGHSIVESALRRQGAGWEAAVPLSAPADEAYAPDVAMGAEGDGLVVWDDHDARNSGVAFAAYDATGPLLADLSVPASGSAGSAIGVSMSASDRWSAVAATGWDFGDGATAAGTSAAHVYAAPGTYTVTAGATDALGNATTATRRITIVAPDPSITFAPTGPPGTVGTSPRLVVAIPGASSGSTPARRGAPSAARRRALHVTVVVPAIRAGAKGILSVRPDRALSGALVRVQLRAGVRWRTVAQGRVSGRRIPVALAFASPGRYLVRIRITEAGRAPVSTVADVVVRAR